MNSLQSLRDVNGVPKFISLPKRNSNCVIIIEIETDCLGEFKGSITFNNGMSLINIKNARVWFDSIRFGHIGQVGNRVSPILVHCCYCPILIKV